MGGRGEKLSPHFDEKRHTYTLSSSSSSCLSLFQSVLPAVIAAGDVFRRLLSVCRVVPPFALKRSLFARYSIAESLQSPEKFSLTRSPLSLSSSKGSSRKRLMMTAAAVRRCLSGLFHFETGCSFPSEERKGKPVGNGLDCCCTYAFIVEEPAFGRRADSKIGKCSFARSPHNGIISLTFFRCCLHPIH